MPDPDTLTRVALHGLGNIGLRHLQGLGAIASSIHLDGVDPDPSSRERADAEWLRLAGRGSFHADQAGLDPAEIVIVATSARSRARIFNDAVKAGPRAVVLEKVVFQKPEDFDPAIAESDRLGIPVYVNCPRRLWPLYHAVKSVVDAEGLRSLSVRGRNIGLACNSVHYIDLLQYLSGEADIECDSAELEDVVKSKRDGYFECVGAMGFTTPAGCRLDISARSDDPDDAQVRLVTGRRQLTLNESAGTVTDDADRPVIEQDRAPYQSELTGALVRDLITNGRCDLASLAESRAAHVPFLKALGRHFTQSGIDVSDGVPIT